MNRTYLPLFALLLVLLVTAGQCGTAPAAEAGPPDVMVMEPFARASMPNGAVFMKLMNNGGQDDALVSAQSNVAQAVELHQSKIDENGVMKMSPVPNIPIPAGGSATLEPGGLHVMLMGLNQELSVGDTFSLTLNFEKSGAKTVEVEVKESLMGQKMDMDSMAQDGEEMDSMEHGEGEMQE